MSHRNIKSKLKKSPSKSTERDYNLFRCKSEVGHRNGFKKSLSRDRQTHRQTVGRS